MAFPLLGNSDLMVVSVSIDFPSNSQWDAPFHRIAYDYSCADWDSLHDHLRDVPLEDVFKLSASAAANIYPSPKVSGQASLISMVFQLLV